MTDRLRRLDALFAEKVLGFEVAVDPLDGESILFQGEHQLWGKVPSYTRSIDAAWEGAIALARKKEAGFVGITWWPEGDNNPELVKATFPGDDRKCDSCERWNSHLHEGEASHPAEALVIALLRAKGVSEEELA